MRKYENGKYRDMTPSEIASMKAETRAAMRAERQRPLSNEEVSRLFFTQQINTLTVDDNTALRMLNYYPEWVPNTDYEKGFKVRYNNKLWRVLQAHTSQLTWEPVNAASLWEQICETHDGTEEDPIPYEGNMALTAELYYEQDETLYLCNRDSGNPVYQSLADLVGLYVEVVV